jgi:hypothetical protein
MYRTIASRLTAQFQVDGSHLNRYLARRAIVQRSLLEELVLHNQIFVPTPDFLTADGLVLIVGERAVLDLLESDRLRFIRTRSNLCFVRGSGKEGGLAVFSDPNRKKPQDAEIEEAVRAGLNVIDGSLKERKKLEGLIIQRSLNVDTSEILDAVRKEAIADFRNSSTWRWRFNFANPDLLVLPGIKKMQVKVIGMDPDPLGNPVDTLLSLVLYNADFYLGRKFDCISTSPFFPIGDVLRIKALRAIGRSDALWNLFEMNSVPDFSGVDLSEYENFKRLHKVTLGRKAESFREWFHSRESWEESDILKEYLSVLQDVPWTQTLPTRILRFIATTGLGFIPGIGQAASFVDAFVFDRIFRRGSPKFFIDDLSQLALTTGLQPVNSRDTEKAQCP